MGHNVYIARRRAKFVSCIGEQVNIPYGTVLKAQDGFLMWKDKLLCVDTSQNAYDYFSHNDDGCGVERGTLVSIITHRLQRKQDGGYQERWDKVWEDPICQRYRRPEHEDHWLWNYGFYNAPVEDLQHIAMLIGAKV